jgi:hypothetical protein
MFSLKTYLRNLNFYQPTDGTNEDEYNRHMSLSRSIDTNSD